MGLIDDIKGALNPVTADQFKSTVSKRGGLAAANRFSVTMTSPQASVNKDLISLAAAALTRNFNHIVNDPRDINILCQSCSLPGRLIMTGDYDAYGIKPIKYPTAVVEEDVEFTFLLTNDYYVKKFFDRWMASIIDNEFDTGLIEYDQNYKTDVYIQQFDKNNSPVYGIRLIDAYPTSVNSVELNNDSTDTVTSISVNMTYRKFENEDAVKSIVNSTKNKLSIFKKLI
tara:strand:+ start:12438 stop:13121 length:684 start_codon:yes stop_codon:yes gene_type:complete